ncbi:unnamed protein product [Allacma fusca]|uniref:Uncharacterized protein n=1 Tax=Allacma fusca TaxID=39272 RepID=A0A8J2PSJ9_9HEXA|nr:unnamed protein product [Allacma fusca]
MDIKPTEALRVRMRMEFKNKLKSLTLKHNSKQEYCCDCETLPPSPAVSPSIVSIRRTSTTATLGPMLTISRKSSKGAHEIRSYGISSESAEYLKAHPEIKAADVNPKRIPHDEIGNVMAAFTNLHLAHEIAINRCYRLKNMDDSVIPSQNAETKSKMEEVMWELLEEEVEKNISFHHTLGLVEDLRNSIVSLMMPHNIELREQLHQVIHLERLTNESKRNGFDYGCYLPYILDVLAQICCPSRDAQVEAARKIKNPVEIFKAIYQLVENMKIDMENFFINLYRPSIIRGTIENERKKFADFLELEYRLHEDGLRATRAWLARHCVGVRDPATVIAKAYGEILCWKNKEPWPETLLEDVERLQKLCKTLQRIGVVGGVVLELGRACHRIFKNPPPRLRQIFSRYMKILIPEEETSDEKKLQSCLEKAAQKAVEATEQVASKYMQRSLTPEEMKYMYDGVVSVAAPEHNFRNLIIRRTRDHAEEIILAANDYHTPVPSTLSSVMYEVAILVNNFHRIVIHNRACFGELYRDIIEDKNKKPLYPAENNSNWDISLLETLKKLRSRMATQDEAFMLDKYSGELHGDVRISSSEEDRSSAEETPFTRHVKILESSQPSFVRNQTSKGRLQKPKFDMETKSFQYFEDIEDSETEIKQIAPTDESELLKNAKELYGNEDRTFKEFCTDCIFEYTKKGGNGGQCETCLQRRSEYPGNLSNSDSGSGWSFWGTAKSTSSNQSCGCGDLKAKDPCKKDDPCKKPDSCGKEDTDCKNLSTEFKKPCGGSCPPWPAPQIPALCKPQWLCCPAKITVPPYPCPKGVEIRPISEGGRSNKCPGGKCTKCGAATSANSGAPKVSPQCPMMKPKCQTAATKAAQGADADKKGGGGGGFMSKISSFFNFFGGKEKPEKEKK